MTEISSGDVIRRAPGQIDTNIEGEIVAMHIESGRIFGMAETASHIWSRIDAPISFGDLIEILADEYTIDRDTCRSDVAAFLIQLREHGLIEISNEVR
ncbi:MAG: PqqD family protein [Hyphomicrobiaceae bacterium]